MSSSLNPKNISYFAKLTTVQPEDETLYATRLQIISDLKRIAVRVPTLLKTKKKHLICQN